jgi:hypothetical protein
VRYTVHVIKTDCQENIISYAESRNGDVVAWSEADNELWEEWQNSKPFGTLDRAQKKWKAMLNALKKLLYEMVESGKMNQDEANAKLEQWLRENPEPNPDDAYEVTEEFERQPIPVYIPDRVELQ